MSNVSAKKPALTVPAPTRGNASSALAQTVARSAAKEAGGAPQDATVRASHTHSNPFGQVCLLSMMLNTTRNPQRTARHVQFLLEERQKRQLRKRVQAMALHLHRLVGRAVSPAQIVVQEGCQMQKLRLSQRKRRRRLA